MSKPIYKFFMARFSQAWYQLSEEQQNSLTAKLNEALEKVGAKRVILCNSSWSSEQWSFAGAEEFPNIEAVQNHTAAFDYTIMNRATFIEKLTEMQQIVAQLLAQLQASQHDKFAAHLYQSHRQ